MQITVYYSRVHFTYISISSVGGIKKGNVNKVTDLNSDLIVHNIRQMSYEVWIGTTIS